MLNYLLTVIYGYLWHHLGEKQFNQKLITANCTLISSLKLDNIKQSENHREIFISK